MSDIKPGDRVQVVRWPCCGDGLGLIRTVSEIVVDPLGLWRCISCGKILLCEVFSNNHPHGGQATCCPVEWLAKLPDLDESETVDAHADQSA